MSRTNTGWDILDRIDNGSTRWVGNEIWKIRHSTYPKDRVDDYSVQLEDDYIQVVGYTEDGQAVLIVQDRVAEGMSLEAVAGGIQADETPEQAAAREFAQESGWKCDWLVFLRFHIPQTDRIVSRTTGNNGAKRGYLFLALGLTWVGQDLGETERIEPILIPWESAVEAAYSGHLVPPTTLGLADGGSTLAILLADRVLRERKLIK